MLLDLAPLQKQLACLLTRSQQPSPAPALLPQATLFLGFPHACGYAVAVMQLGCSWAACILVNCTASQAVACGALILGLSQQTVGGENHVSSFLAALAISATARKLEEQSTDPNVTLATTNTSEKSGG